MRISSVSSDPSFPRHQMHARCRPSQRSHAALLWGHARHRPARRSSPRRGRHRRSVRRLRRLPHHALRPRRRGQLRRATPDADRLLRREPLSPERRDHRRLGGRGAAWGGALLPARPGVAARDGPAPRAALGHARAERPGHATTAASRSGPRSAWPSRTCTSICWRCRSVFQGQGLGRALLDRVHALSRERDDSRGVTLTTEVESNVELYRHVGYEVVGRGTIAPGLGTWGMYRADRGPALPNRRPQADWPHAP